MAKLTKTKQTEVEQLVTDGHSIVSACSLAKVNRSMLYKLMQDDSDFEAVIRAAQRQSAEKSLAELDELYSDALHKRKDYEPNVLRDYATHVR